MKSNFFKIVLPAFALMLAITASLAFTAAESDDALITISPTDIVYYDAAGTCTLVPQLILDKQTPIQCETVDQAKGFCTLVIAFQNRTIYNPSDSVPCTNILYKP